MCLSVVGDRPCWSLFNLLLPQSPVFGIWYLASFVVFSIKGYPGFGYLLSSVKCCASEGRVVSSYLKGWVVVMVCQAASQTRFRALKHENGIAGSATIIVRVIACFQPLQDCQVRETQLSA